MVEYIKVSTDLGTGAVTEQGFHIDTPLLVVMSVLFLLVPIALYVLRTIGLYVLAKRANIKGKVLAIFPCVWMYVACKLIGKQRIFGKTFEKLAVLFCILFTASELITFTQEFIGFFPIIGNFLEGNGTIYLSNAILDSNKYVPTLVSRVYGEAGAFVDPYGSTMYLILNILYYVSVLTDIIAIVIPILVYFNLFRKYWPEHFILALILSVLGLFGVFAFVIRKKEPVDYAKYMREKYQRNYGGYGYPYNQPPYHNPYQAQSRPNPAPRNEQDSPFEEFSDKKGAPEDPFDEFK